MNFNKIKPAISTAEIACALLWLWGSPLAGAILVPWVAVWSVVFLVSILVVYAVGAQRHPDIVKDFDENPVITPLVVAADLAIAVALLTHGFALVFVLQIAARVVATGNRWWTKNRK